MHLTDLPEEIIIMIVRQLDLHTLASMYNTCRTLRAVVCMHGIIKQWKMSLNTMATSNSLKLNFFKDVAGHLQELNLCGVPDLYKTSIMPVMKKLKCLRKIDVSYTNITIMDLLEMLQLCPTICDISVNYVFGKPGLLNISQQMLLQCQSGLEHMKNVNFIGSRNNLLFSELPLFILQKAKLNSLTYTIAECDYASTINNNLENIPLPVIDKFTIFMLNWKESNIYYGCPDNLPVLRKLGMNKYEFIVIIIPQINSYGVNVSPMFKNFFKEYFEIEVQCTTPFDSALIGNVGMWFWNKETTNFDVNFFHKLTKQMKNYFPSLFETSSKTPVSNYVDWFYTMPLASDIPDLKESTKYEPEIRKRRIVAPNLVLNYDTVFKEREKVQLSIVFKTHIPIAVTLTNNCNYLRKITFLSLNGTVRYSSEFFNILFRCCENLETLNVHSSSISPCASSISRSIPLSRSLKNIRLVDKRIDFKTLFSSFSQCSTLENIHVSEDGESELTELGDPSILLEKCLKLYCLCIDAPMSESARTKKLQLVNKAKARCNKYELHIVILAKSMQTSNRYRYTYDPFIDVFNLNPIKPV